MIAQKTCKKDARQPFTTEAMARTAANILERMTGDRCEVVYQGPAWFTIIRVSGSKAGRG